MQSSPKSSPHVTQTASQESLSSRKSLVSRDFALPNIVSWPSFLKETLIHIKSNQANSIRGKSSSILQNKNCNSSQ
ncbi:hypothetical protein BLOT_011804 [Blomia tropicalis]|nr:hypothetical protein BLOT_011804 [Blomia tropicalis]